VLGSNPSTTNFLAVWRWTLVDGVGGCQALVLACFGAGGWGVRLPLALDARGG